MGFSVSIWYIRNGKLYEKGLPREELKRELKRISNINPKEVPKKLFNYSLSVDDIYINFDEMENIKVPYIRCAFKEKTESNSLAQENSFIIEISKKHHKMWNLLKKFCDENESDYLMDTDSIDIDDLFN